MTSKYDFRSWNNPDCGKDPPYERPSNSEGGYANIFKARERIVDFIDEYDHIEIYDTELNKVAIEFHEYKE